jgi:hypothetical protein
LDAAKNIQEWLSDENWVFRFTVDAETGTIPDGEHVTDDATTVIAVKVVYHSFDLITVYHLWHKG